MDAALLTMISALFVAMLGNSWQQSRENSKTRSLMVQLNNDTRIELRGEMRDLGIELRGEMRDLGIELRGEMRDLGNELRGDHKSLSAALGDVRERLARIEGHLGIGIEKPAESETQSSG
ncbi:MAG: hypothetical protein OXN44_04895 [Acidimicrobiaceae bacterium]|nr:hypothetical protein [Acidimicrobiaceae bacterium]